MLYILLLISGSAALIYEIAWSRQIGLLFGHSVHAAAVVLAATFAGMGLGYLFGSRVSTRFQRPMQAYGLAELAVAGWALLTPTLIGMLSHESLSPYLHSEDPAWRLGIRGLATFVILMPATIALGATFPFVAHHLALIKDSAARATARAYAANTLGAVIGVFVATFILLSEFGVLRTGWLAAGLSAFAGLGGLILAFTTRKQIAIQSVYRSEIDRRPNIALKWFLFALLSGAGTLGTQVLYTRLFSLIFHNSTYTFGLVVAVFLIALALGSVIVAIKGPRQGKKGLALALALSGAAIPASLISFLMISGLQLSLQTVRAESGTSEFSTYVLYALMQVLVVVIPPVAAMGTVLPWCWAVAADPSGVVVGRLGAVNTLSAALGALLTSFVLLPWLGLWNCFAVWAFLYLVAAVWQAFTEGSVTAVIVVILGGLLLPASLATLKEFDGPARSDYSLIKRWETPYGWIDVAKREKDNNLRLVQDLHYGFGSSSSAPTMARMGHVPLLLHPQPQKVLFLGLATGITSGASLSHPSVESIDVIELIPEVQEAARYFSDLNGGIVDDPKVRIHLDDARHTLKRESGPWDVIVSDLFVPWHSHAGYLYTVEHYQATRERLSPGGLFCQWLPLWQLGEREFCLIADSMAAVFPYVTVWRADSTDDRPLIALIGANDPITLDAHELDRRLSEIPSDQRDRDRRLQHASIFAAMSYGDWPKSAERPLNTDEHPRLEFSAPVTHADGSLLTGSRYREFRERYLSEGLHEGIIITGLLERSLQIPDEPDDRDDAPADGSDQAAD